MKLLILLKNELLIYSSFELKYGIFLCLDDNRNFTNVEKRYEIFEAYLVNYKNFNLDNKDFLLKAYNNYVTICNNMEFSDKSLMSKTFFKKIMKCHPSMSSKQYYIDRGYNSEYAILHAKLFNSHQYVPTENKWIAFIKTLDTSKRVKIIKTKENILKRFTGKINYDLIDQLRLNIFLNNLHFTNSGLQNILFDQNGMLLNNPVSFEYFKNEIYCNYKDFNLENIDYVTSLYLLYVGKIKDKRFVLCHNYSIFSNFFNLPPNKTQLDVQYWTNMGYSQEEVKKKISETQSKRSLSWEKAISTYGIHANERMELYKDRVRATRLRHKLEDITGTYGMMYSKTIDPSTGEYYNGNALIQKRHDACCKAFNKARQKHIKNLKKHKSFTCYQKEWWMVKGFTEQEAIEKIIDIMPKSNIEWFIEKYGVELGTLKYKQRIEKYKQTISNKSNEEKQLILLKKTKVVHRVSKASISFFETVFLKLYELYNISIKEISSNIWYGNSEYYIYDNEYRRIYFYDLCIQPFNIIIEYNGHLFHPHNIPADQLNNWKSLFYLVDGITQYEKDKRKQKIAIENGYHYLVIWDDDPVSQNYEKTIEFIYNIIKMKNNTNNINGKN